MSRCICISRWVSLRACLPSSPVRMSGVRASHPPTLVKVGTATFASRALIHSRKSTWLGARAK